MHDRVPFNAGGAFGGASTREGEAPADPGCTARQEPRPPELNPVPGISTPRLVQVSLVGRAATLTIGAPGAPGERQAPGLIGTEVLSRRRTDGNRPTSVRIP